MMGHKSMTRTVLALVAATLALTACAEINRPIEVNDPWRDKATSLPSAVPR